MEEGILSRAAKAAKEKILEVGDVIDTARTDAECRRIERDHALRFAASKGEQWAVTEMMSQSQSQGVGSDIWRSAKQAAGDVGFVAGRMATAAGGQVVAAATYVVPELEQLGGSTTNSTMAEIDQVYDDDEWGRRRQERGAPRHAVEPVRALSSFRPSTAAPAPTPSPAVDKPVHNVPVIAPTPPDDVVYDCIASSWCPHHCTSISDHMQVPKVTRVVPAPALVPAPVVVATNGHSGLREQPVPASRLPSAPRCAHAPTAPTSETSDDGGELGVQGELAAAAAEVLQIGRAMFALGKGELESSLARAENEVWLHASSCSLGSADTWPFDLKGDPLLLGGPGRGRGRSLGVFVFGRPPPLRLVHYAFGTFCGRRSQREWRLTVGAVCPWMCPWPCRCACMQVARSAMAHVSYVNRVQQEPSSPRHCRARQRLSWAMVLSYRLPEGGRWDHAAAATAYPT
jgi:hypothetical protein